MRAIMLCAASWHLAPTLYVCKRLSHGQTTSDGKVIATKIYSDSASYAHARRYNRTILSQATVVFLASKNNYIRVTYVSRTAIAKITVGRFVRCDNCPARTLYTSHTRDRINNDSRAKKKNKQHHKKIGNYNAIEGRFIFLSSLIFSHI